MRMKNSNRILRASPLTILVSTLAAGLALSTALVTAQTVPFPPRHETFDFRVNHLEPKYRDGLRRAPLQTFVDIEGDVVWTQEYLRYRMGGVSHPDAVSYVAGDIDRVTGFPGLLSLPQVQKLAAFPPRNESFAFRVELERIYRDRLRRPANLSYVDLEGALVWTQQYLSHRVTGCAHLEAVQKVMEEIDTGRTTPCGPPSECTYAISAPSSTFSAGGGSGQFSIQTQAGCAWYVMRTVSAEDFVRVGEQTRNGSATVSYTVLPGTSGPPPLPRTGQLLIFESPTNRRLLSHSVTQTP